MKFTKEIKIALVSILGIVVLFFGMQFLKGLSLFGNDNSYYVAFVDATGLSQSAPVYANGYRVGVVKSLEYDYSPQGKIRLLPQVSGHSHVAVGHHTRIQRTALSASDHLHAGARYGTAAAADPKSGTASKNPDRQ